GILAAAELHIDQYLRALAHAATGLLQGFAAPFERQQHLQGGNYGISGAGVPATDDVPGILATELPAALLQFGHYIAIAHFGPREGNLHFAQGQLETQVAHQGAHHAAIAHQAALLQVARNDEQQLVTVDHASGVIHHQHPIAIAIESDAEVRTLSDHLGL